MAILGQGKGTHVILVYEGGRYSIALCFEEVMCPKDVACFVIKTNEFSFSQTFGVKFLFVGGTKDRAAAEGEQSTGMPATIVVGLMGGINVPMDV